MDFKKKVLLIYIKQIYVVYSTGKRKYLVLSKYFETRMKTSISSKALLHYRQTDGQNIYRIDAHLCGESAHKKNGAISQLGAEKITFPPKRG